MLRVIVAVAVVAFQLVTFDPLRALAGTTIREPQPQSGSEPKVDSDSVWVDSQGVRHFGPASMRRFRGIWLLDLHGTREDMALQHGRLIADQVSETALPYFSHKIHHSVAQTYILKDFPWLSGAVQAAVDFYVQRPMRQRIPDEDRKVALALAHGVGIPEKEALDAWIVPDAGQWLTSKIFGKNQLLSDFFAPIPGLGCSSFVSMPPSGHESSFLHARNLDYEGYGIFEKNPAVLYFHPNDPRQLRYVSITSLGIHTAGITATNEAGITLSLHQTMVSEVSRRHLPILSATEKVIREARTLEQAITMLQDEKVDGSWKIILSSSRENRAASVEVSGDATAVEIHPVSPGNYVATNHVQTLRMQRKEFSPSYRFYEDSRFRYRNLKAMLQREPYPSAQSAVDMISSPEFFESLDANPVPRSSHGIVAKMNNIQSVVFLPTQRLAYVAVAPLLAAKPVEGEYVPVPLDTPAESRLAGLPGNLTRTVPYAIETIEAHTLYRRAAALATEEGRFEEALALIIEAARLEPKEGLYPILGAITAMRAAANRRPTSAEGRGLLDQARELLVRADSLRVAPYHQSLIHLFLGRYFDLTGERQHALQQYRLVDTRFSRSLTEQTDKHLKCAYRLGDARKLVADYLHGDVYRF